MSPWGRVRPTQPVVCSNDWRVLEPSQLGAWEPTLSVTVVVPTHDGRHLPLVLAALSVQTYPAHLLEVVVVDDSDVSQVVLPRLRPERTRIVRTAAGWGRAAACQTGAEVAQGQVLHWLDADMVPVPHEVEAQMRWHHLIDYAVVLGSKSFAQADALAHLPAELLAERLRVGGSVDDLAAGPVEAHGWVEAIYRETELLATAGPRAMRAHTGASGSVRKELFWQAGGMPTKLVLGEDIVLGYRLREVGAVFVPDRQAHSLHLGLTSVMKDQQRVNRLNAPHIADHVPEFRSHRPRVPRSYAVPYVEVVVPVGEASYEAVRACVDALLCWAPPDLEVTLVGPWADLPSHRRRVLEDQTADLRMLRAFYDSEPRVRTLEQPASHSAATFRLELPGVGEFPAGRALEELVHNAELAHDGTIDVQLKGGVARLVRTAAAARSRHLASGSEAGDKFLRAVYPHRQLSALEAGFVGRESAPPVGRLPGLVDWGVGPT